jgi:hypothetical protein
LKHAAALLPHAPRPPPLAAARRPSPGRRDARPPAALNICHMASFVGASTVASRPGCSRDSSQLDVLQGCRDAASELRCAAALCCCAVLLSCAAALCCCAVRPAELRSALARQAPLLHHRHNDRCGDASKHPPTHRPTHPKPQTSLHPAPRLVSTQAPDQPPPAAHLFTAQANSVRLARRAASASEGQQSHLPQVIWQNPVGSTRAGAQGRSGGQWGQRSICGCGACDAAAMGPPQGGERQAVPVMPCHTRLWLGLAAGRGEAGRASDALPDRLWLGASSRQPRLPQHGWAPAGRQALRQPRTLGHLFDCFQHEWLGALSKLVLIPAAGGRPRISDCSVAALPGAAWGCSDACNGASQGCSGACRRVSARSRGCRPPTSTCSWGG